MHIALGKQSVPGPTHAHITLVRVLSAGERHPLATVADDIATTGDPWKAYYELEAPESAPLPGDYSSRLSKFEMLLLLRCLRVDRVVVGITHFVIQTLGSRYVTPPVLDYHTIFRQSSPTTPVVFVLSPGADPAFDVFRWATIASLAHSELSSVLPH
jgi:dynein heavy chain